MGLPEWGVSEVHVAPRAGFTSSRWAHPLSGDKKAWCCPEGGRGVWWGGDKDGALFESRGM